MATTEFFAPGMKSALFTDSNDVALDQQCKNNIMNQHYSQQNLKLPDQQSHNTVLSAQQDAPNVNPLPIPTVPLNGFIFETDLHSLLEACPSHWLPPRNHFVCPFFPFCLAHFDNFEDICLHIASTHCKSHLSLQYLEGFDVNLLDAIPIITEQLSRSHNKLLSRPQVRTLVVSLAATLNTMMSSGLPLI